MRRRVSVKFKPGGAVGGAVAPLVGDVGPVVEGPGGAPGTAALRV